MVGGGVPKNFAQDTVVCAEILGRRGRDAQATPCRSPWPTCATAPARPRRSKEAASWGKVQTTCEQMVFAEATTVVPLIASDAYHRGPGRPASKPRWAKLFDKDEARAGAIRPFFLNLTASRHFPASRSTAMPELSNLLSPASKDLAEGARTPDRGGDRRGSLDESHLGKGGDPVEGARGLTSRLVIARPCRACLRAIAPVLRKSAMASSPSLDR